MPNKQLLHLVMGGRVTDPHGHEFENLAEVDIVGLYPNYAEALKAWRQKSQENVDDAMKRYFLVHVHRLMDANPGAEDSH